MGAKEDRGKLFPERPCIVVSADAFNINCDRVTVVPLTDYADGKEDTIGLRGFTIAPRRDLSIDPNNQHYSDGQLRDNEKSIVDCGQLWTVFAPQQSANIQSRPAPLPDDVRRDRRYGELLDQNRLDMVLQVLVGGTVHRAPGGTRLTFAQGDVLAMDLPGRPRQLCLVVSSSAIDAVREQIIVTYLGQRRPLGHLTVVPLEDGKTYKDDEAIAQISVRYSSGGAIGVFAAICQEVYTVDWRERGAKGPVGKAIDLGAVYDGLRKYLDLPAAGA